VADGSLDRLPRHDSNNAEGGSPAKGTREGVGRGSPGVVVFAVKIGIEEDVLRVLPEEVEPAVGEVVKNSDWPQEGRQWDGDVLVDEGDALGGGGVVMVVLLTMPASHPLLGGLPHAADSTKHSMGILAELQDPHGNLIALVERTMASVLMEKGGGVELNLGDERHYGERGSESWAGFGGWSW